MQLFESIFEFKFSQRGFFSIEKVFTIAFYWRNKKNTEEYHNIDCIDGRNSIWCRLTTEIKRTK